MLELYENPYSYKNCRENEFEEAWDTLEAENIFQRQSWTNYVRQTVVFM